MPVSMLVNFSMVVLIVGALIYKHSGGKLQKWEGALALVLPIVLIIISLAISETKISGTIEQTAYGWPHFFLGFTKRDVVSGEGWNHWFLPFHAILYIAVNYFFYFSFVFLGIILRQVRQNKD